MKEKYSRPLVSVGAYSRAAIHHDPAAESYSRSLRPDPMSHKRESGLGRDSLLRERAHKHIPSGLGGSCKILQHGIGEKEMSGLLD